MKDCNATSAQRNKTRQEAKTTTLTLLRQIAQCAIVALVTTTSPEDLIGSLEAAKLLRRSKRYVHRLVDAKRLETAMTIPGGTNGTYLFRRADVEAVVPLYGKTANAA